jgi:glycosyltransferase involved in cell wall biosynthesis
VSSSASAQTTKTGDRSDARRDLRVVISNGTKNFHLSSAASEVDASGHLLALFNGIYPTKRVQGIVRLLGLARWSRMRRMLGRAVQIDQARVRVFALADLINDFAVNVRRYRAFASVEQKLNMAAMTLFARRADRLLETAYPSTNIYHYRAGFGLQSIAGAKRRGALVLCDHSIVHPLVLDAMVDTGGRLPEPERWRASGIWSLVLQDIDAADHVLVNSDFVKTTFTHVGFEPSRVSVIYLGVDDAFLDTVPDRELKGQNEPLRFLFAGSFSRRKGADTLIEALVGLPDTGWTLDIAGPVEPSVQPALDRLLQRPQVHHVGNLSRPDLAKAMSRADAFVFPSLAEGSARVVFEALACGCYVITTPNTGSIVEDGLHGRLIPPGDTDALRRALEATIADPATVARIGRNNTALIRSNYTQRAYGDALRTLYGRLLNDSAASPLLPPKTP